MQRRLSHELMDDPDVDRSTLDRALRYIRSVNRWLGGQRSLIGSLQRWSKDWRRGQTVTLIDVATGSADLPIEARRWALGEGFDLRITGIDLHETTLALAAEHVAAQPEAVREGITLARADALELVERFGAGSFDYAHAGLFLHHLPELRVMTVLRIMDRLARRGVVWNDLVRSRIAHTFIRAATLGQPEIVRHDAVVSVEAGFTRAEVLDFARRVGLEGARYRWTPLGYRFTLQTFK